MAWEVYHADSLINHQIDPSNRINQILNLADRGNSFIFEQVSEFPRKSFFGASFNRKREKNLGFVIEGCKSLSLEYISYSVLQKGV